MRPDSVGRADIVLLSIVQCPETILSKSEVGEGTPLHRVLAPSKRIPGWERGEVSSRAKRIPAKPGFPMLR